MAEIVIDVHPSPDLAGARREARSNGFAFGHSLTQLEQRVMMLVLSGNRNPAIAAALGITEQVVKNYIHSVYRKLGIHSIRELFPLVIAGSREIRLEQTALTPEQLLHAYSNGHIPTSLLPLNWRAWKRVSDYVNAKIGARK
jgi:DNA-binding CsgD family transcriptional regulator